MGLNSLISLVTFIFQIGLTYLSLSFVYMAYVLLDYEGGFEAFIGVILLQPLFALVLASITIAACLLIGLPIRLTAGLNLWWREHVFIAVAMAFVGLCLCAASFLPGQMDETIIVTEGAEITKKIPDAALAISGWFSLAFGTLHLYMPLGMQRSMERLISRLLKG